MRQAKQKDWYTKRELSVRLKISPSLANALLYGRVSIGTRRVVDSLGRHMPVPVYDCADIIAAREDARG